MAEWRYAKLADGTTLRFPANTPDEVVHRTVKSRVSEERANAMFPPQDVPEMSAPMPMMDAQFPAQSPEPRTVAEALAPAQPALPRRLPGEPGLSADPRSGAGKFVDDVQTFLDPRVVDKTPSSELGRAIAVGFDQAGAAAYETAPYIPEIPGGIADTISSAITEDEQLAPLVDLARRIAGISPGGQSYEDPNPTVKYLKETSREAAEKYRKRAIKNQRFSRDVFAADPTDPFSFIKIVTSDPGEAILQVIEGLPTQALMLGPAAVAGALTGIGGAAVTARSIESAMEASATMHGLVQSGMNEQLAREIATSKVFLANMPLAALDAAQFGAVLRLMPPGAKQVLGGIATEALVRIPMKILMLGFAVKSEGLEEGFQSMLNGWAEGEKLSLDPRTWDQESVALGELNALLLAGTGATVAEVVENRQRKFEQLEKEEKEAQNVEDQIATEADIDQLVSLVESETPGAPVEVSQEDLDAASLPGSMFSTTPEVEQTTELGIEDDLMKPQPASEDDLKKIGKGIKSPELVAARKAASKKHTGIEHEVMDKWAAGEAGFTDEAIPKILNRDVFDDTDQMTKKEMDALAENLRTAALEAETGKPAEVGTSTENAKTTEPNQADKEAALILAQKNLNLFRQNLETEAAEEGVKMADLAVGKLDELRRLEGEYDQARKAAESTRKPKEKRETTEEEREFRGKEIDDAFAEGTLIPPGEEDSRSFEEKKQEDLFGKGAAVAGPKPYAEMTEDELHKELFRLEEVELENAGAYGKPTAEIEEKIDVLKDEIERRGEKARPAPETKIEDETTAPETPPEPKKTKFSILSSTAQLKVSGLKEQLYEATTEEEVDELHETYKGQLGVDRGKKKVPWKGYVPYNSDKLWDLAKKRIRNTGSPRPKPQKKALSELQRGVEAGDAKALIRNHVLESGGIYANPKDWGEEIWGGGDSEYGKINEVAFLRKGPQHRSKSGPDELFEWAIEAGYVSRDQFQDVTEFVKWALGGSYKIQEATAPAASRVEPKTKAEKAAADRGVRVKSIRNAVPERMGALDAVLEKHNIRPDSAGSSTLTEREAAAIEYAADLVLAEGGVGAHERNIEFVEANKEMLSKLPKDELKVFEDLFKATVERVVDETGEDAYAYGEPEDKDKVPFDPEGGPRQLTEDELPVLTVRPPADHFAANAPNTTARPLMLEEDKNKAGKRPVGRREVNDRIAEAVLELGITAPVSVGRMGRLSNRARGFFLIHDEVIRIKQAENFWTMMHEFGHAIQKHVLGYPKGGPFTKVNGFEKPIRDELMELGKNLYGDTKPSIGGYKSEGFAEGWKLYLVNPELLKKSYPLTYEWIDSYISKNKKAAKLFKKAQAVAQTYIHQGARLRAQMDMVDLQSFRERAKKTKEFFEHNSPTAQWMESGRTLVDLEQAGESILGRKLTRAESPMFALASRRMRHPSITRNWVETEQTDWGGYRVGPSLAEAMSLVRDAPVQTLRSFLNQFTSTRSKDFGSYLWAMRTIALSETGRNSGMVLDDAKYLKVYFEDEYPQFEKAGSMVWTWNDNALLYAAEASPTFARVVAMVMAGDPGNYVPLKRVFDEYNHKYRKFREESPSGTGKSLVQHLRGSNRSVKQIFPQMISQAENNIRAAHQERVIHTIFELAKIEGMGRFLTRVPVAREIKLKIGMGDVFDRIRDEMANLGVQMDELDEAISEGDREAMNKVLMTFWGNANRAQTGAEPVVARVNDAGVVEFWQVNMPELYGALEGMDSYHFGGTNTDGGKLFQAAMKYGFEIPGSTLRAGTTGLRASFGLVTNPSRDLQTLLVNTQSTSTAPGVLWAYLTSMTEAFLFTLSRGGPMAEEIFGKSFKSDAVDMFVRMGGQATQPLTQDSDQARQAAKRLLQAKGFRVLDYKNWINFYQDIVQTPEMAPRIAEIKLLAKQHGIDIQTPTATEALFLSLSGGEVTTDFTASGTIGRVLNRIMPFFNANIQGPRANLRAMKRNVIEMQAALKGGDTTLGKSRTASRLAAAKGLTFFIRGAQMASISLALWYNNKDKDWWKELKLRDKYIDWHIDLSDLLDEPTVLRIPRAFEVGLVFAAFPEALLDQWYHDDPEAVKSWFLFSLDYMNPFNATVLAGEGLAQLRGAGGYDGFFDTPIDSLGDVLSKKKEARDRYGPYTTGLAIWLGDKLNWSPKRIDHFIRNTLGPVGSDIAALTTGRGPGFIESDEKSNHAIYGRLFTRGGDIAPNPRSVTKLYNLFEEYDKTPDDETDEHKVARLLLRDATKLTSTLSKVYTLSESSTPEGRKHRRAIRLEQIRVAKDAMAAVESDDVWEMMRERRWVKGDKKDWDWEYESRQEEVKERGHLR